MKAAFRFMAVVVVIVGCSSQEPGASPSPEQVEKMRQQYIEQAKAFNAQPAPTKQ